ncbi:PREDICTED: uncharacterized protein LOC105114801 isoform X2 [Populus euphratica]|uniref:Uncharacterized protein LOC105114801 isoform X1 n=1 Tax=Populus euphratica TaxID=75702 RepID=A0AAJ6TET6_POPEU|nr:PREDICTED: uncharacterized protein LOC105114801 isoform X1 [Populus euphratica]XP_011009798.1 PREDICTED: uncharacterized protein LOC105114801 isoform X2 [Populus euphratica]
MQTMDWNLVAPVIWNLLTMLKAGMACNHVVVSFSNWIRVFLPLGTCFFFLVRSLHPLDISVLLQSSNLLIISLVLNLVPGARIKGGLALSILDHFLCNPTHFIFVTFGGDWSLNIQKTMSIDVFVHQQSVRHRLSPWPFNLDQITTVAIIFLKFVATGGFSCLMQACLVSEVCYQTFLDYEKIQLDNKKFVFLERR